MIRHRAVFALVIFGVFSSLREVEAQPQSFVQQGVVCEVEGAVTYTGPGPIVTEDFNQVNALRESEHDPFVPKPRPSVQTKMDATVSSCLWLLGDELDSCLPADGVISYRATGLTVSDTACANRTFHGTFQQVDAAGNLVQGSAGPACSGSFQCGHATSEIVIDVAKQVDGGEDEANDNPVSENNPVDLIDDPGSVDAEANNGRGESLSLTEQCTFELLTTAEGSTAERRFGLITLQFYDDPETEETLGDFLSACSDAQKTPASAPFVGLLGSSAGF